MINETSRNLGNFMGVKADNVDVLGKLLYFSLSNVLVERDRLQDICDAVGIGYSGGARLSDVNAFRSATGDIYHRIVDGTSIYKVYCRDNEKSGDLISRELVKETLDASTNRYTKLANIWFNKTTGEMGYDNVDYNPFVSPYTYCEEALSLFEKYKTCAGRKHIETIANSFLDKMQAVKVNCHGRIFIVPRTHMEQVSLFEDFIEALNKHNQNTAELDVNSMYIVDDEKQRAKMASEFYTSVRKEIEMYQERAKHLITTNSQSPAVMNRWIDKIDSLDIKKSQYEDILQRDLSELNSEFATLRMFSQELQIRSRKIGLGKCA